VTPFAVFLFRQFYLSVPPELEDAARIDGLGEWSIWARIASPLIKPAFRHRRVADLPGVVQQLPLAAADHHRGRQAGSSWADRLKESGEGFTTQWNLLMAGTTMASLPMIVLFR